MSVWLPVGRELSPEGWHERLVELVQGQARARMELGRLVDEFARRSGHHELGFSSLLEAGSREPGSRDGLISGCR